MVEFLRPQKPVALSGARGKSHTGSQTPRSAWVEPTNARMCIEPSNEHPEGVRVSKVCGCRKCACVESMRLSKARGCQKRVGVKSVWVSKACGCQKHAGVKSVWVSSLESEAIRMSSTLVADMEKDDEERRM